jgi:hypothetical protein
VSSPPATANQSLPAVQLVGHDSAFTTPRFVLVRDPDSWNALRAEHTGTPPKDGATGRHAVPKIDFTRFMVVGVFSGASTNTVGEVAHSVTVTDDLVRVRFQSSTFQTASFGNAPDPGVKTTPFGLWVIETSNSPVVIEEGRSTLKNSPITWTQVQRFESK